MSQRPAALIIFDGDCGLCHRGVHFLARRTTGQDLGFVPGASPLAQELLQKHGLLGMELKTVVFCDAAHAGIRAEAVGRALALSSKRRWRLAARLLLALPRWLSDCLYRAIAAKRQLFLGKSELCSLQDAAQLKGRLFTE